MIRRVAAQAELDDAAQGAAPVERRAAEGDGDSAWLLDEWRQGHVLLARVTVTVEAATDGGEPVTVGHVIEGGWLEREAPPAVERQVAETAPAVFGELAAELAGHGISLAPGALEAAFLHVELGPRLRGALLRDYAR